MGNLTSTTDARGFGKLFSHGPRNSLTGEIQGVASGVNISAQFTYNSLTLHR
jgi:hypothetical protein